MNDLPRPGTAKTSAKRPRPVVLCVLDGWGERPDAEDNAVTRATTPNWHRFMAECPHAQLDASELEVGLPPGQMGNSEVGHMNLGAGRVVMQDLPRIDAAVSSGRFAALPALQEFIAALKRSGGTAHILGLLSPGGVHSHQDHFAAAVNAIDSAGVKVVVHALLDGRDTPPKSAVGYMRQFLADIAGAKGARIGTVGGRYYGMDRDKNWARVRLAYEAMVLGQGARAADPIAAIEASYAAGKTDEFMLPAAISDYAGMADGDGLFMINFRADRARQILTTLVDPRFDGFARAKVVRFVACLGMTEYSDALNGFMRTLFAAEKLTNVLGEVLAKAGLTQLRIAETEKYAHVTFFFNGGEEKIFPGEERILVPSPKVATYDLQPEMSAPEVTDKLVAAIQSGKFDFICVNYANTDMVGHTGIFAAARKAVETVDRCIGRVAAAVQAAGGRLLITADHGNAEMMSDPATRQSHTAHTMNPVPIVLVGHDAPTGLRNGRLADVAPTVLHLMGIAAPAEMTGRSLLAGPEAATRPVRAEERARA
ncbi:MAG: 2,3-bisphosphoglycerate-independent phosphoglycerate mutase [Alphaproteobacteria bacterium]